MDPTDPGAFSSENKRAGSGRGPTDGRSRAGSPMEKVTIVVHSGDLDRFMSALIIGNGFLAMGAEVTLYFTFWALQRLVRGRLSNAPLSRMNFFGLGAWMMRRRSGM